MSKLECYRYPYVETLPPNGSKSFTTHNCQQAHLEYTEFCHVNALLNHSQQHTDGVFNAKPGFLNPQNYPEREKNIGRNTPHRNEYR